MRSHVLVVLACMITSEELQDGAASLLEKLSGVSRITFSKWDHGKLQPTFASLEKLAKASEMNHSEILAALQYRRARCDRKQQANKSLREKLRLKKEEIKCRA